MSYIGHLVWFSVHNTSQPVGLALEAARERFAELGLDDQYLPRAILPVDAFHAASSATVVSYVDDVTEQKVELKSKRISQTPEQHTRHVIRHAHNPKTGLVASARLIKMDFCAGDRSSRGRKADGHTVMVDVASRLVEASLGGQAGKAFAVSDQDRAMAAQWLAAFETEYELLRTHLRADPLRTIIRNYLTDCDALLANAKGGLYFIPPAHEDTITALREFVARIHPECVLHDVGLADTAEHRALINRLWRDAVTAELARINTSVQSLTADKQPSSKAYALSVKKPWDLVRARADLYAALSGASGEEVRALLQPTAQAVNSLGQLIASGAQRTRRPQ